MKKILVLLILVVAGLIACTNDKIVFPDYKYISGSFPYQYPVRTLVLGDYIYDNTNDNNHQFLISAQIGGIYTNTKDRVFDIQVDPTLCNKIRFSATGDTIKMMPSAYYSLSSSTQLVVPKGEYNGGITVQLTDAFFNDPLAIKLAYVIPVRLVSSTDVDTILQGNSALASPDPRVSTPGQWNILPKNFTMFAVKYINPYHGMYLHRGANTVRNASNTIIEKSVYHKLYNTQDELWSLVTTGLNKVKVSGGTHSVMVPGTLNMELTFASDGSCTVTQSTGSAYTITGTGSFKTGGDNWGNQARDAIYINYTLTSGNYSYAATDTLVIRDRQVVMQIYSPVVYAK